jgi:hypothetical protein
MAINRTGKEEKPRFTGDEKIRLRKILKDNPVYFDKILRDLYKPPAKKAKPNSVGPELRDKKGALKRALLNKGGIVKGK